jgi:muramoyltetrapeptide carboxypeptidase
MTIPMTRRSLRPEMLMMSICTVVIAGTCGCQSAGFSKEPELIKPAALKPGDTIAFIAPSSALDQKRMQLAKERLEARGYRTQQPDNLFRIRGYLAGTDEERAAEVMAAFTDPNVDAVFPGSGGYGATRMVQLLDYDAIRANPKILIGFSDITALHLAIHKQTGLITFHSPNPMWGLGSPGNMASLADRYFWRTLEQSAYEESPDEPGFVYEWTADEHGELETISPGVARGRLVGGNLSLIAAMMGSPYEIETAGKILFFEDVDEYSYRVDRYLAELRLAGKLQQAAGVIICNFNNCDEQPGRPALSQAQVLEDYFADCGIPVVKNFPAGHMKQNVTLPIGAMVELDADQKRVRLLEDPVQWK